MELKGSVKETIQTLRKEEQKKSESEGILQAKKQRLRADAFLSVWDKRRAICACLTVLVNLCVCV